MGCSSSAPVAEDGKHKQPKKSGPSASAQASSAQGAGAAPAAPKDDARKPGSRVTVVSDRTDDDELHEIDRLLQGTKSELRMRPLELSDELSPTKPTRSPGERGIPDAAHHPTAPRPGSITPTHGGAAASSSNGPDGPGTPPQGGSITKQQSLQPLRPPALPGTLSPGPTSPGAAHTQQQQQQAAIHSDDPWASLQSAYRIDPAQAQGGLSSPTQPLKGPGPLPGGNLSKVPAGRGAGANGVHRAESDILVLDDDDDGGGVGGGKGSQPLYARQQAPVHLSTKPKQGGWGAGAMAQAGTLMVGGDVEEMDRLAPPGVGGRGAGGQGQAQGPPSPSLDANEFERIKQRIKANAAVADLGVEDIEDVDELIEQEAKRGGLGGDLAAKLAAFEALNGDD